MNWIHLNDLQQLDQVVRDSEHKPVLLFKHSTRCSISDMAKARLDRSNLSDSMDAYYLDLIAHRPISQAIAERFGVHHESPQILLIRNGECILDASHNGILPAEIAEEAARSLQA